MALRSVAALACAGAMTGCASAKHAAARSAVASPSVSGSVVVFAAASLKGTFTTLATQFENDHPGVKVVTSFGGSDSLAAQIVGGAPVDVFAAANTTTMATVEKAHDADPATDFATNTLEIAVAPGNPLHIAGLADLAKPGVELAVCASSVPCGVAADKALQAASVTVRPVTQEQDVTSVLTKVELGEVDAGLVYRTDVKAAGAKVTGVDFAEASHAVNTYPIAVVTTGKNVRAAAVFVQFVLSPRGQQVLRAAGFQAATS